MNKKKTQTMDHKKSEEMEESSRDSVKKLIKIKKIQTEILKKIVERKMSSGNSFATDE